MTESATPPIPLKHLRSGKVRDVYELGDDLLMVASDRISAFDVIMPDPIPEKGVILNQLSAFWFQKLADLGPHHVISVDDQEIASRVGSNIASLRGRSMIVRKCAPIPIECVARGYLAGSWWKDYRSGRREIHGMRLPDDFTESARLPEPIFTPATKAEKGHDENISMAQAADIVGAELAQHLRDQTLALYSSAAQYAESRGLILADTKFEFGLIEDEVVWMDEALTPDSSRYWDATSYRPGTAQESFDKQFLRDYLETLDWNKQAPGPKLPTEVIQGTRSRYLDAYQRITTHVLAL